MATSGVDGSGVQLKHLDLVKILLIYAVDLGWRLYGLAKQMSGPFKSTVEMAESLLTPIVRPFYNQFRQLTIHVLVFLDNEVDEAIHIFDKHAPPTTKDVVSKAGSVVKKASDLLNIEAKLKSPIADLDKISEAASSKTEEHAPPVLKGVLSEAKKASDLAHEALAGGPLAAISKTASSTSAASPLPITKGIVGSLFKKTSDLVQEGPMAAPKKAFGGLFGESPLPIAKGIGSMVKKTTDLVHEGPIAAISNAGKEASHILDGGALPLAKGVGSIVKKASDLVQEGPIAAISQVGKEASNILDKGPLPIGSIVKKASDLVQGGPIAAISQAGSIAKGAVSMAGSMAKNASELVHVAVAQGPSAVFSHAGTMFMEFVMMQLIPIWFKINQYSFLHRILEIVVPIIEYLLKKYNSLVKHLKGKGWGGWINYVPLVPLEEIEMAYKVAEAAATAARRSGELMEQAAAATGIFNIFGSHKD